MTMTRNEQLLIEELTLEVKKLIRYTLARQVREGV